ncbi:hypothetical protein [Streptomyces adelaidensis]|uniref:hypothetical protein n=1 Tax=Streptomyces adelaidensis TaxID=2796465 RepID=UPI0019059518|nr:hypothetical protein [Streptomyces adelaidensis]
MTQNSQRSWAMKAAARLGTVATAAVLLVGVNAGMVQAASMSWSGDFSWRVTEVKRLANCSATEWYNTGNSGGQITDCNSAGSNSYWDGVRLHAADYHGIEGKKVAYRSDRSCPDKDGFQYVRCYYVGGKSKGNPVMTVAIESYGLGGQDVNVTWYYL